MSTRRALSIFALAITIGVSPFLTKARAEFDYDQPIRKTKPSARTGSQSPKAPATATPRNTNTPAPRGAVPPTATPRGPNPFERKMDIFGQ